MRNLNVSKVTSSHSKRTLGLQPPKMLVLTPKKHTHISIKFNPQASSKMFENSSFDHQTSEKTPVYISTVQFRETTGPPPWVRSRRHRVDVGPADLGNFGVAVLPAWRCRIPEIVRDRRRGFFFYEVLLGCTNRNSQRSPAKRTYYLFVLVDKSTSW